MLKAKMQQKQIGYSKMEGEYPIRMRVTQEEATQIANELNSGKPKYPVVAHV